MTDSVSGWITLLTDFGLRDGYVGVMKGVIAGIHPPARVLDITHEVPPQDIHSAAFLIERSYRYFPEGAVHVVVVDPGVGSDRRGMILRSRGHYFVGPDNGVFSGVMEGAEARTLARPLFWLDKVSNTFHGRDIFAPVAAHLAKGVPFKNFGPVLRRPVMLEDPSPRRTKEGWAGRVVYVDRFGNLITNLGTESIESLKGRSAEILLEEGLAWPFVKTYSEVPIGSRLAVLGGFERLELSIHGGDAKAETKVGVGARVLLRLKKSTKANRT